MHKGTEKEIIEIVSWLEAVEQLVQLKVSSL